MSTTKNHLSKLGGTEVVVGINTVGIVFLYYKLSELGSDLNKKIAALTGIIKKINKNTNIVNMHLKSHLIKHKTEYDNDDVLSNENDLNEILDQEFKDQILSKIRVLEERLINIETVHNPIINKKSSEEDD